MTDELITIASYEFVAEGEIAQMVLRENGVDAFLRDQSIVAMDWLLGNAIGYVKVQVPASQAERAIEVLEALKQSSPKDGEAGAEGTPTCPTCGLVLGDDAEECPACAEVSEEAVGDDADDDVAFDRNFTQHDSDESLDDNDDEEHPGLISRARVLKKPIFVIWLLPIFIFLTLAVFALIEGLLSGLGGLGGR